MKPLVKLITVWVGALPKFYRPFWRRLNTNKIVEHVSLFPGLSAFNKRVSQTLNVECKKRSGYNLCDLRPMFGHIFAVELFDADWWGWCDFDICVGDLDSLLPPLLDEFDVVSTDYYVLNGAMTLLRNCPQVNLLYRQADWESVVRNPNYCNFDEGGFNERDPLTKEVINKNPNFTQAVNDSDLRVHYDDRSWSEGRDILSNGSPSRICELAGNKLIEVPTGRELLLYHFSTKRWPLREGIKQ